MPTEFTVRGSHSAFQPPERATAQVTLSFQGPALQPVYDRVVADLEAVKASVQEPPRPRPGTGHLVVHRPRAHLGRAPLEPGRQAGCRSCTTPASGCR
ncbi:SIMPL domain-containing protein [Nocardioides convexus]|uniref:SIMPL domain-containing protein n=1 Tax=Nocardioides convexus TaxID=2712224 RepID=UPI002418A95E|nr:SIMPL domain-containing protein [Nocardioides convexus]